MTLPTSRNTTYAAAVEVKSADLNAIQDAIIGMKHPEIEIPQHGSGWLPGAYTGGYAYGSEWSMPAGGGGFTCPIFPPVGSRITQCKFGFKRASAGSISYELIRTPLIGSGGVVIANAADAASVGYVIQTIAAINHIVLADNGYALLVIFDAASAAAGSKLVGGSHFRDRL